MKDISGKEIRLSAYVILPDLSIERFTHNRHGTDVVLYPEYCDASDSEGKTVGSIDEWSNGRANGYAVIFTDGSYCYFSTSEYQEDIDIGRLFDINFFLGTEVFSAEQKSWIKARIADKKKLTEEQSRANKLTQFNRLKTELGL